MHTHPIPSHVSGCVPDQGHRSKTDLLLGIRICRSFEQSQPAINPSFLFTLEVSRRGLTLAFAHVTRPARPLGPLYTRRSRCASAPCWRSGSCCTWRPCACCATAMAPACLAWARAVPTWLFQVRQCSMWLDAYRSASVHASGTHPGLLRRVGASASCGDELRSASEVHQMKLKHLRKGEAESSVTWRLEKLPLCVFRRAVQAQSARRLSDGDL